MIYIILTCYLLMHADTHYQSKYIHTCRHTVKSFTGLSEYVFSNLPGVRYFISEKLCQDPLEGLFGKQWMRGGYSDNPTVQSFLHGTVSLRAKKSVALAPKRGNCKGRMQPLTLIPPPFQRDRDFRGGKK